MKIEITEDAELDLSDGFWFYERQTPGLDDYFRSSLIADIDSLVFMPGSTSRSLGIIVHSRSDFRSPSRRQTYYVPNRLLWPARGLDPHGQHARVSLKAADLWAAADKGTDLPFSERDDPSSQMELFGE